MKRSHRVALKPTPEPESLFSQHAGYARFAYNWAVGEFKAGMDDGEGLLDTPAVLKVKGNAPSMPSSTLVRRPPSGERIASA